MNTKAEKKGNFFMLLSFAIATVMGCNTGVGNMDKWEGVSVELRKVLSNYPIQAVDTIAPLPEIVFILVFKNNTELDYSLGFQNLMTGKDDSNLSIVINCSNGKLARLPIFQNTGKSSFLKKQGELTLTFKARSRDILTEFGKCAEGYLGEIIKKETESLTVVYRTEELKFKAHCVRQHFESPEYFLIE